MGQISRLLGGGHLFLAYRIFGVLAAFGFLWASDLWLRRLGLPESHRLPALLLVASGGGLGGILFTLTSRSVTECLDLYAGLFPFLGLVTNPHFTAGTTLLCWACFSSRRDGGWRDRRGHRGGHRRGARAPLRFRLARPDPRAFGGRPRAAAPLGRRPRSSGRAASGHRPTSIGFSTGTPPSRSTPRPAMSFLLCRICASLWHPSSRSLSWASSGPPVGEADSRRVRVYLMVWAAFGVVVVLARPVHFSLQFLGGIGFPFLALGAFGLSRWRPAITIIARRGLLDQLPRDVALRVHATRLLDGAALRARGRPTLCVPFAGPGTSFSRPPPSASTRTA